MAKKKLIDEKAKLDEKEKIVPELIDREEDNPLRQTIETLEKENSELRKNLNTLSRPHLVVIPYKKNEAQGLELLFAIKGWIHHFKERFKLVVVGDYEEFLDSFPEEIVSYIPHVCNTDNPPIDIVEKLQTVIASFPDFERLILSNDDIYAVNDFDINDVCLLKSTGLLADAINIGDLYKTNRDRTLKILEKEKLSIFDYGCHLPILLDVECLLELIEKYNMTKEAYLLSSLYFNYFFRNRIPFRLDIATDYLKCGVYRENPNLIVIKDAFTRKIWINNSPAGWVAGLQTLLEEHYC